MSPFTEALAPFLNREMNAALGTTLFRQGDPIQYYYVVRSGCMHLVRWGPEGTSAVMQRATEGTVLAESSVFADAYHCDAVCVSEATIARADMDRVRQALDSNPNLLCALAQHLGREVHRLRSRLEVVSRRTVADRIDGWLALNGGSLPARGEWRPVAEDIGVSPEAFYRELQRRRKRPV